MSAESVDLDEDAIYQTIVGLLEAKRTKFNHEMLKQYVHGRVVMLKRCDTSRLPLSRRTDDASKVRLTTVKNWVRDFLDKR